MNFTRIWGGSAFFIEKMPKWGGVSTFFIKYGLIKEKICKYFAFFGGGSENFSLKNFFREGDLGGVYTELLNFGGGLDGIGRKWGGAASGARRASNWYTPPLGCL